MGPEVGMYATVTLGVLSFGLAASASFLVNALRNKNTYI